jgi:predicted DNA binding CopG/RHH family protein
MKYPNQRIFIIDIEDYIYLVPFVEDEKSMFLKTIIPSRKMTKKIFAWRTKKMKLSKEEKELLKSVEDGEWETISDFKSEQKRYQAIAKNSLKKDERINIRLATKDLMGIQKKAMQEGLPYQTLISSVLHRYVTGQLKPVEAE